MPAPPSAFPHPRGEESAVQGAVSVVLQVCVCVENLLPLLVLRHWKRPRERTVADKLLAALSAIYILSALVASPLALASHFHGKWYGGRATCECFQVTSTWCRLSALAVVTYLAVHLHLTACSPHRLPPTSPASKQHKSWNTCGHQGQSLQSSSTHTDRMVQSGHGCPPASPSHSSAGREFTTLVIVLLVLITLLIASLPLAGYGPPVTLTLGPNVTCDQWLIQTPARGQRRTYFLAVLTFGFTCLTTCLVTVTSALLTLRSRSRQQQRWAAWDGLPRYTEEEPAHGSHLLGNGDPASRGVRGGGGEPVSDSYCYKMAGVVLVNQVTWLPVLVIVTIQKAGYPVTDATIMYAILFTSLPGLLNPLLLALLYSDYRHGYRYVLRSLCCCCPSDGQLVNAMTHLRSRSTESPNRTQDNGHLTNHHTAQQDTHDLSTATAKTYPVRACAGSDDTGSDAQQCQSYVVVEVAAVPQPPSAVASNGRPIMASMYDEYGELSEVPKTELLSPCGSQECLLNPELFRAHTESVV